MYRSAKGGTSTWRAGNNILILSELAQGLEYVAEETSIIIVVIGVVDRRPLVRGFLVCVT